MRRYEAALSCFDAASRLDPSYAEAHNNRGNALHDLGHCEEALISYDKALALKPDHAEPHSNRGLTLVDLLRYEDAVLSYDKALALNPELAEVHNNRGIALGDLRRYEEALISYEKALALRPGYAEARSNLLFYLNYIAGVTPESSRGASRMGQIPCPGGAFPPRGRRRSRAAPAHRLCLARFPPAFRGLFPVAAGRSA